jgi:hypothetical protein
MQWWALEKRKDTLVAPWSSLDMTVYVRIVTNSRDCPGFFLIFNEE